MSIKIYIVRGEHGDYEEREVWNVAAFHTEELAKEFACKLNELAEFDKAFKERMRIECEELCRAKMEWPTMPPKPFTNQTHRLVAAACANGRGSPEDKALYSKSQKDHMSRLGEWNKECDRVSAIYVVSNKALEAAKKEWEQANYNLPEHLKEVAQYNRDHWDRSYYDYEECELIS